MIRTVAELLFALKEREADRLASVDLVHGPTIGDMYEGLSMDILRRAIPSALGLRLESGFVTDGAGVLSGQIDCMLVRGQGEAIPYTGKYKWHVKDVVAVFEIKKSLLGDELADAFTHLQVVRQLEHNWFTHLRDTKGSISIKSAQRAFAEATGFFAPEQNEINSLDPFRQLLFHILILEQVSAIRVVFGYDGFQTESGFRNSLVNFLGRNLEIPGFGPGSFPQLIVSGGYSLVKTNGQPFSAPLADGRWPFYCSSSVNPLQIMLELIWTRLARDFNLGVPWGEDLTIEALRPLILGSVEERAGRLGWNYEYIKASQAELIANDDYNNWQPAHLSLSSSPSSSSCVPDLKYALTTTSIHT
jgi:hypothetical protein